MLPELLIPAAGQQDRRLWGRACNRKGIKIEENERILSVRNQVCSVQYSDQKNLKREFLALLLIAEKKWGLSTTENKHCYRCGA